MTMTTKIGIIGGSGFYEFLNGEEIDISTPFGKPSDKILLADPFDPAQGSPFDPPAVSRIEPTQGRTIAFLPRHGKKHQIPPHKINYRANIYALKKLGVKTIISSTAVGSLKSYIKPGDFVLTDQFINAAFCRFDTFFDTGGNNVASQAGGSANPNEPLDKKFANAENAWQLLFNKVAHISMAEPYCPSLRQIAKNACQKLKFDCHAKGTAIIIQGPRFSTTAESLFWSQFADTINMTQYPEVALAKELEMCYLNISLVTDYDAGLKNQPNIAPVSAQEISQVFKQNNEKLKQLILEIIASLPNERTCSCHESLKTAFL